jgi:hypothetical protein
MSGCTIDRDDDKDCPQPLSGSARLLRGAFRLAFLCPPLVRVMRQAVLAYFERESAHHVAIDARRRLRLPGWILKRLALQPGARRHLLVVEEMIVLGPSELRPFTAGQLLLNGSIRLPSLVLDAARSGPLVFEQLTPVSVMLRPAAQAQGGSGPALPAPPEGSVEASISAAGLLRMPPNVLRKLGAQPGATILFVPREDGAFEVQTRDALVRRVTSDLRGLFGADSSTESLLEDRRAEAREEETPDPLAGAWQGSVPAFPGRLSRT